MCSPLLALIHRVYIYTKMYIVYTCTSMCVCNVIRNINIQISYKSIVILCVAMQNVPQYNRSREGITDLSNAMACS